MIVYKIEYLESVITDDIPKLPKVEKKRINKAIGKRLINDPVRFGKPLRYSLKGCRRMRVGHYRVIFKLETKVILIVKIGHRKEIYQVK